MNAYHTTQHALAVAAIIELQITRRIIQAARAELAARYAARRAV